MIFVHYRIYTKHSIFKVLICKTFFVPEILETVKKIEGLLNEVAALQKEYVDRVCGTCEAPCCKRVHYLFNEKDIIFFRLSRRKHKWRRENFKQKGDVGSWVRPDVFSILNPD
jgi:hypothetical protein